MTMRFRATGWSGADAPSGLRERRRSFIGPGVCVIGGVGSCAWDEAGGEMGSGIAMGIGEARRAWRARHVVRRFPKAGWVESCGGLAGGDTNSADWSRVSGGGCESHEKADGINMLADEIYI